MANKVNEALFDLIQSMSKSEKRYFKLISSRHKIGEQNNYVRIFDRIEKQDVYNEEQLFGFFKGEAFLNKFSITKKRLYDHILSALDAYHASNSIDVKLHKMLHSVDILFKRSLYGQSKRMLNSAKKIAVKYEKSAILIQILNKEKQIIETSGYSNISPQRIDDMFSDEIAHINRVQGYNEIWNIKSRLFSHLAKKGVARCGTEVDRYKEICAPLLNGSDHFMLSADASYLYYHTMSAYYYAISDLSASLEFLRKNLHHFNSLPRALEIDANKKFSVLTNAIYICDKLGAYKDSIQYLNQLKVMAIQMRSNQDLEIKLFSSIRSIELSMKLRQGAFDEACQIAAKVIEGLQVYGSKVTATRRLFLEFKIAIAFLGVGEYKTALFWTNKILNDQELEKNEDLAGFTQLIDLLIHIELNHNHLLPYSLKSTQRYFKIRDRMYSFERVFLKFIGRLVKCNDHFNSMVLWEGLCQELSTITNEDVFESVALEYFDFQSWAESKLKGKTFSSVVREKHKMRMRAAS